METESERLPRQLAAILYADVVGFSRMTEEDEEATYRAVRTSLDLFADTVKACGGEVKNYAGDAILAQFHSAEDALICAACVQDKMPHHNASTPDERKIRFRIGLNLGDVIQDRGDIFGDGVNVAARLEGLAKPEGICVSGSFYDAVVMKLPFDFEFMGEQQVKNIKKPIRAYQVSLQEGAVLPKMNAKTSQADELLPHKIKPMFVNPAIFAGLLILLGFILGFSFWPDESKQNKTVLSDKPSIIVLPFVNRSDDQEQEYFSDGITEDIITDLSRISNLQVMARNTSFRYKGQVVKPEDIGKELNVRYLLEGSVRKAGDKLRINSQLIDTSNGYHVWAERFDRRLEQVFAVQDEVTRNIVNALAIQLTDQEETSLARVSTNNFQAYEHFLLGQKYGRERTREGFNRAVDEFKQAIKLDPQYARSYGALAIILSRMATNAFTDSPVEFEDRALEMAKKAVQLNDTLPHTYWALGFVQLYRNEFEDAARAVEQSINIAPNYADGYGLLALIHNRLGNADKAIEFITKGMKLNPHYSWDYPYNLGRAYYYKGDYDKAIELLRTALARNENTMQPRLYLTASLSAAGMIDDAEWEVEQVLTINPAMSLSHIANASGISNPELMQMYMAHLRKAGLPD